MKRKQNIKTVLSLVLLALFCCYMGGITLFPHVHIVDGVVICHSHPYSGASDNPGHSHTSAGFETIARLSMALFVSALLFGVLLYFARTIHRSARWETVPVYGKSITPGHLRGPPYC